MDFEVKQNEESDGIIEETRVGQRHSSKATPTGLVPMAFKQGITNWPGPYGIQARHHQLAWSIWLHISGLDLHRSDCNYTPLRIRIYDLVRSDL